MKKLLLIFLFSFNTFASVDFTIVGGGSSGMYMALALTDMGYSVKVLEKNNRVGGKTHTFRNENGVATEIGVTFYQKVPKVLNLFKRLGIKLKKVKPIFLSGFPDNKDLKSGENVKFEINGAKFIIEKLR